MKRSQVIVPLAVVGLCAIIYILNAIIPLLLLPKVIMVQANGVLYTVNMNESNFTRLTPGDVLTYHPVWSPDGQRLACMHRILYDEVGISLIDKGSGEPEIILSDISGDNFRLNPTQSAGLAWSPDGNQILFSALSKNGETLFLLDIDTGQVTQPAIALELGSQGYPAFAWSRAGLAIEAGGEIYLVDLKTGEATYLVAGTAPFWKPDSETLTFLCADSESWRGLCTISLETGEKEILYQPEQCCINGHNGMQWSSDGRYIVYQESSGESDPRYITILDTKTRRPYRVGSWLFSIDEVLLIPDER